MPNRDNIKSPITLISFGRSGSSLLSKAFELHQDFSMVGETGNFIFDLWNAYEFSSGNIAPLLEDGVWISDEERAGRLIRQAFMTCFSDTKPQWCHKPIGVPRALSLKFGNQWDEAAKWYWQTMRCSFPAARYFTILRNPLDVTLSAKSYWGFDEASIWWGQGLMAYLLSHPASLIKYAVFYEDLILKPEETLKNLFDYLELSFKPSLLEAFDTVHAASKGREQFHPEMVSRKTEWPQLDAGAINPAYLAYLSKLFERFGRALEVPDSLLNSTSGIACTATEDSSEEKADEAGDNNIIRLNKVIADLNGRLELIHSEYGNKIIKREQEFYALFDEQQKWIAQLQEAKEWLVNQNRILEGL